MFDIEEVRINSKRPETREKLAGEIRARLALNAVACDSAEDTVRDADIVVEATRLEKPEILIDDGWLKPDCLLVAYGWVMANRPGDGQARLQGRGRRLGAVLQGAGSFIR